MKKLLLLLVMMLLPLVACAYDFGVKNADGVTIYYDYSSDGEELIVASGGYSGSVVIPEKVTYKNRTRKVTGIARNAFNGCSSLTSVTIPNSVTSIGNSAFFGCSSLASVTIPNSVISIGESVFYGCSNLTSVIIGNSVTDIDEKAFCRCSSLISLTIGNSVINIDKKAFYSCSSLTSVTIPNSVTSIGDEAFQGCSSLTSVTIGNNVTNIGESAFYGCSNLTSVTIPNSVTSIGKGAFDGVDMPYIVSLIEKPFDISGKASIYRTFSTNTFNNAILYVPKGTIDKYKSTWGWQDFLFIEEGTTDGVAQIPSKAVLIQSDGGILKVEGVDDGTQVSVYTSDGKQAGSVVCRNGAALVSTNIQPGNTAIVKIGEKTVKVIIK